MAAAERPEVRVVDPDRPRGTTADRTAADVLASGPPGARARRWPVVAVGLLVLAAVVVRHGQGSPPLALQAVELRGDGTLAVSLVNRGDAVRVTGVSLRAEGLAETTGGALAEEVAAAEDRGTPVVHDSARPLAAGRHTFLLGVRGACPTRRSTAGQVLVDVDSGGVRRTLAGTVPAGLLARLRCEPLSLRAGVAPTASVPGQVALLLTAHAGQAQGTPGLQRLVWAGYQVSGVSGVVPLALGWAGADSDVVFDAVVTPDCAAPAAGGLTAVFTRGPLTVGVTDAAATRVRALRATCP